MQGVPVGAVYALIAIGFVLAYKTSGVFNLAFGAQAFVSAAAYFELHVRREWPIWAALLVSVGLLAPLLGLLLERLVFRHLRGASPVAKLVASLGLLIAVPEAFKVLTDFDRAPSFGAVGIVPDGRTVYRIFDRYPVTRDELVQLAVAVLGAVALALLFRATAIGLRMRAVVESPRMTDQRGIDAEAVSAFAWMLSSLFAGLSGVLLAQRFVTIQPSSFFQLMVVAIAAAAIGRLTSLPWALAGGLLLGVATTLLATFLDPASLLARHLGPALPFLVLFGVIVGAPSLRRKGEVVDPLAGVQPPAPGAIAEVGDPRVALAVRAVGWGIVAIGLVWAFLRADDFWLLIITDAVIFSVIFLSIVVITGLAGQLSLAQSAFASMGAFAVMQLADDFGLPVLVGALIGTGIAALVGVALALPVLRLGGVWLALSTLAFALFYDAIIVKLEWVGGSSLLGTAVPRPVIGPFDFADDRAYLVLCVVVLAVVGLLVGRIRVGTTGTILRALRGDELAASSVGIVPWKVRIAAFALASGIAALGGALLAIRQGIVTYEISFSPFVGLFWLLVVVALNGRTVAGAIQAAIAYKVLPALGSGSSGGSTSWMFVVFGVAAITFARHPEGIFEHGVRRLRLALSRLVGAAPSEPTAPASEGAAA